MPFSSFGTPSFQSLHSLQLILMGLVSSWRIQRRIQYNRTNERKIIQLTSLYSFLETITVDRGQQQKIQLPSASEVTRMAKAGKDHCAPWHGMLKMRQRIQHMPEWPC